MLLPFACWGKDDQPSFMDHFSDHKIVCLFARFQWKITPEWKTCIKLNLQIQNKQHDEVLETHTGPCHREHHPFSAVDVSEWRPEALYPKGVNRYKVYKAFCSTLSEFHRIRPKQSFLANTPQSVFVILWYRSFQTKVRHKKRFRIGISMSLVNHL